MKLKLYDGNNKVFLKAYSMALAENARYGVFHHPICGEIPTKRQYTKWKQKRGMAYGKKIEAERELKKGD